MRFMTLVKTPGDCPPPPPSFLEAMQRVSEEAARAGTLIESGGLAPIARGASVRLSSGKATVTDGPFIESKEVVGGYGVIEASSRDEALEAVMGLVRLHQEHWPGWEGEFELRQILGPDDFAPGAPVP